MDLVPLLLPLDQVVPLVLKVQKDLVIQFHLLVQAVQMDLKVLTVQSHLLDQLVLQVHLVLVFLVCQLVPALRAAHWALQDLVVLHVRVPQLALAFQVPLSVLVCLQYLFHLLDLVHPLGQVNHLVLLVQLVQMGLMVLVHHGLPWDPLVQVLLSARMVQQDREGLFHLFLQ